MKNLKDKVVVVTGGSGGIGAALCERFAQEGAKVAIIDLNEAGARSVQEKITSAGGTASAHAVDISDYELVVGAISDIERRHGPVDVLVNNAGWDHAARFLDTDPPLWDKLIRINLKGPINLHHAVLRGMAERGRGRIVNVASDAGRVGSSGESVYSACKGGIIAFTKTIAREFARKQINVNVVCPGRRTPPCSAISPAKGKAVKSSEKPWSGQYPSAAWDSPAMSWAPSVSLPPMMRRSSRARSYRCPADSRWRADAKEACKPLWPD